MKLLKKIGNKILKIMILIKIIITSLLYKNRLYIIGTPIHGNIGDQAILIAEKRFLKDKFSKYKIIEIESNMLNKHIKLLKKIIKKNFILISGGGFLGNLWLNEEDMFRKVLINFPQNNVIVFPQTIFFSNDEEGLRTLQESIKIYSNHQHLTICCREKYSYDFMKDNFNKVNIMLIPDMVLYLKPQNLNSVRNDILFCLRKDKEKINYHLDETINELKKDYSIFITDTVINKSIYSFNRNKILLKKLQEFSQYKLVVTDRLHGMIFAYLTKTPCLVLENKSYKIRGVYEWLKDIDYIKLTNDKNLKKDLRDFNKRSFNFNNGDYTVKYNELEKLIDIKLKGE